MKKIEITAYGAPEEVAHCIDAPAVGDPGPDEVVFDVLAFPINPADISFCRGSYRLRPPLPASNAKASALAASPRSLVRSSPPSASSAVR